MPVKTKPVSGQSSWGNVLNTHLEQLIPNSGGGINTFDIFTDRPIYKTGTSTPLDADDVGLTYLFTQTGNLHRFTWNTSLNNNAGGGEWKVLNESLINVKDYGAVGNANYYHNNEYYADAAFTVVSTDDTVALQKCFDLAKSGFVSTGEDQLGFDKNLNKTVLISTGSYKITKSLVLMGGVRVTGMHKEDSVI